LNSRTLDDLSKTINSPIPFWFLNGTMHEWHIIREFEMMSEKGVEAVIVHPRYGLQTDYLSDDWFRLFGWCVREAKKHGMHVWIYDELNWPSGTAGMTVQKADPSFRSKFLAVEEKPLSAIDLAEFVPGRCVVAANIESGKVTKTRLVESIEELRGLTADWRIFNCTLSYDECYVDTLSWAAVNKFKEATYEEYYRRFGSEFGKTIRAIFTDEPSIYWVSVGTDDWNIPYTDDYFETFERRFGYDPAPMIPHLFYPGGAGTAFRADYWDHAGYLFNERYHGNLGGWCRDHGIIYTGHNNNEEPLRYQIRFQGNAYDTMRVMDIPGVDHLAKQTLGNWFISIIGHKICSSATHIAGKSRCMSESFGVMDWDTTYTNIKRVTDWQYALGINMLIPHAVFHTISGLTKRESPPSFFYQSPHWDNFDYYAAYLKRMEDMLCGGRHTCKVAVLYPLSGLWAAYQSDRKTPEFEHTDNFLNSLCLELVKNQIDFDLIDSRAVAEADLSDGRIRLADERYEHLIVPHSSYLRPAEAKLLESVAASGVRTTLFFKSMEPGKHNVPDGLKAGSFVRTEELVSFVEVLRREVDHDIQIAGGGADDIMAYRREKDGHKITYLLNRSDKHRKVTAILKDYPAAAIFDQETGTYTRLSGRRVGQSKLQAQLRFQPDQSYFIVSDVGDAAERIEPEKEPVPVPIEIDRVWLPFNVASIYHFTYTKSGEVPTEVDIRKNPRFIPANWDKNPPTFDQFAGVYEADIEFDVAIDGIRMVVDSDFAECEVYLNDARLHFAPCCADSDAGFYLTDFGDVHADISHAIRRGMNRIRVVSPTKLSEPVRFVGHFAVRLDGDSVTVVESEAIKLYNLELAYPFYSGTITYSGEFEMVADKWSDLALDLHDVKDAVSIRVNRTEVGKRLWAPYVFNIADFARQGRNTIEIEVRNNMANLIHGNPRALGLRKPPTLAVFE